MLFSGLSLAATATTLLSLVSAAPAAPVDVRAVLPPMILLAGDSTTATGKGWGDAFIKNTIKAPAKAVNYGHSGATIPTFKSMGDWATVLAAVKANKATHQVLVTIQFGHNDQKVAAAKSGYSANLKGLVADVVAAGGTPIIVTSLTRRSFTKGVLKMSLSEQVAEALAVATATGARFIDLNKASAAYVSKIGEAAAQKYNLAASDTTHLNALGGKVFGRIVSDLLTAKYPDIKAYTVADAALSAKIAAGTAVTA